MHGWDYFFLVLIGVNVLGAFIVKPHQLDKKTRDAFGDEAPALVAIFGSGLCLVLDQAVVGHSFWLYIIGGLMMGFIILAMHYQENQQQHNQRSKHAKVPLGTVCGDHHRGCNG